MQEILKFNRPSRVVMHFKQDEEIGRQAWDADSLLPSRNWR